MLGDWRPVQQIRLPKLSEREKLRLRAAELRRTAKTEGIRTPPNVELIRWTRIDDYARIQAECIRRAGFPAEESYPGVEFPGGIPPQQAKAFGIVLYTCEAEYTVDPSYGRDWSTAQKEMLYDYWVQFLVPCLGSYGISVAAAPSRELFVARYPNVDWDPPASMTSDSQRAIRKNCPSQPPSRYFWGEV